ncbi:putative nuclease HARBI1 [Thunnus maccoyii]|uniref:putative nuclease HARBI1 n=1 Tax=Thunnus maccoyii TaxID=8240 RepID=UPI001C4CC9FE|nr:putative nuclease HARBI1 [Thunnus maccoyii]
MEDFRERDQQDLLGDDDEWLISQFRLPQAVLLDLSAVLGSALQRSNHRNQAVPLPLQVLTTLGFLATGTFQRELADRSGISQPTFNRVMTDVLGGIIGLLHLFIKFPYTVGEQANKKAQFAAVSSFPNVIGAIDCTHVSIRTPGESGYPHQWWLLTPFLNPQSTEERNYNVCHSQASAVVESTIRLLKGSGIALMPQVENCHTSPKRCAKS